MSVNPQPALAAGVDVKAAVASVTAAAAEVMHKPAAAPAASGRVGADRIPPADEDSDISGPDLSWRLLKKPSPGGGGGGGGKKQATAGGGPRAPAPVATNGTEEEVIEILDSDESSD